MLSPIPIDYQSESVQQAVVNELTRLSNVGAANMEYLLLTTTQGQTKDPKDEAAIDVLLTLVQLINPNYQLLHLQ